MLEAEEGNAEMEMVEEAERKRKKREKLKRRSTINARLDTDMVAVLPHNKLLDLCSAELVEHRHVDKREPPIYTLSSEGNDEVVELGTEIDCLDEGYDYAIAIVEKETGRATFRSARVLKFQAKYTNNIDVLLGRKLKSEMDFTIDNSINAEEVVLKRRQLTEAHGSAKKLKIQESSIKRKINEDTLDAMRRTAFASKTVLSTKEEIKFEQISLVNKPESSVLPTPIEAEFAAEIYPISLFVSEDETAELAPLAQEFLKSSKKDLSNKGFPECVLQIMERYNDPKRATGFVLLATQVSLLSIICKGKASFIPKHDIESSQFPEVFINKVRSQYMPGDYDRGSNNRGMARLKLSALDRDRLMAHSLALALSLSVNNSIPISPWQKTTNFPVTKLEKMLQALGCDLFTCDTEQAYKYDSIRGARLMRVPNREAKTPRRRSQRRQ